MPVLTAAYAALALDLQESAFALSSGDTRDRLSKSVSNHFRNGDSYGYYLDHFGDAEAGDVVYSSNGDTFKAP